MLQKPEYCTDLEETIRQIPIEFFILETDAPYVKPDCPNLSGKQRKKARNTSLILTAVANRIAELKGLSPEEVECITTENAMRLFHIGK